jgi:hypothetical protein
MKSGTSSLHAYLAEHPEIFMCEPKEPSFFVEREDLKLWYPSMEEKGIWKGEDRYLALFAGAGDRRIIGESSTCYTKLPQIQGVIGRLARFAPKARFIYIMRDPVERTISHYWHLVLHHNEKRDILSAIQQEPHYRDVSYYAMQLAPFIQQWGRESLLALTMEEMSSDPHQLMRRVLHWLGVDETFVPRGLGTPEHVTPEEIRQATGWSIMHALRQSSAYRAIRPAIPESIRSLATRLTRRTVSRRDVAAESVKAYLRPIQREQTRELTALIGRQFPEWKTLYGESR